MERLLPTLALAAVIGACSPAPETAEAKAADVAAPAPAAAPAAAPVADVIPKAGEDYWTIRPRLADAGFTPVDVNDEEFTVCTEAMVEKREISPEQCASPVVILPEVDSCAGTGAGNCLIHWRSPDGRFLTIHTVGGPQPGTVEAIEWSDTRPAFQE